jgi:hypothetical protein
MSNATQTHDCTLKGAQAPQKAALMDHLRGRVVSPKRRIAVNEWMAQARRLLPIASAETIDLDALAVLLSTSPPTAEVVACLVHLAGKEALNNRQRRAAMSKNAAARRWVLKQWEARVKEDGFGYVSRVNKAEFARHVAPKIAAKFGANVTPGWIAREWLPTPEMSPLPEDGDLIAWAGGKFVYHEPKKG